jgi:hypothetical protein
VAQSPLAGTFLDDFETVLLSRLIAQIALKFDPPPADVFVEARKPLANLMEEVFYGRSVRRFACIPCAFG